MGQGKPQYGKGGQRPPSGPSLANRFNGTFSGPVGGSGGGNKDRPVPTGPASMSASNGQSLAYRMASGAGPAATPPASSASTKQPQHPSVSSKQVPLAQRLATSKPPPSPAPSAPPSRPPYAQANAPLSSTSRPPPLNRPSSASGGTRLAERLAQPAGPSSDDRGPARPAAQPARSGAAQQVEQPRPLAQRLDGSSAAPAASTRGPSPASSSGAPPRATSSALGTAPQAPLAQRLSLADVSRPASRAESPGEIRRAHTTSSRPSSSAAGASATAHAGVGSSRATTGAQPASRGAAQQSSASFPQRPLPHHPPAPARPQQPPRRSPPLRVSMQRRPSPPPRDMRSSHADHPSRPYPPSRPDPRPHDPLPRRDDYRQAHDYRDDYRDDYRRNPYDYQDDYDYDNRYRRASGPDGDRDGRSAASRSSYDARTAPPSRPAPNPRTAPPARSTDKAPPPVRGAAAPQLPDGPLSAPTPQLPVSSAPATTSSTTTAARLPPPPSTSSNPKPPPPQHANKPVPVPPRPSAATFPPRPSLASGSPSSCPAPPIRAGTPPGPPPEPAARPTAPRPRPSGDEAGTPPRPPPRTSPAGTPPLQPAAMRAAAPALAARAGAQQEAARERPRQAPQAQPQPRQAAQPPARLGAPALQIPRPAQQQQAPPRPAPASTQAPSAARAAQPPTPLAARVKPEPPSPDSSHPSLAPASTSTIADVKPLLGRLGPLPHAADPSAPSSASAADLRTMKERADELRAAEARAAELRKLEAVEAKERDERERRAVEERRGKERREADARREKERREADARREEEEREKEERKEMERLEAAEREKDKRREKERLEMERREKERLEMERRRTDEMVEAARRNAEERAAAMSRQRALEEEHEAERVRAERRAAVEAAAAAAAAEEERSVALRRVEERAVAELRAAEAELREAEARAAARRSSKERAQGAAATQPDRTRETTAEGIAREIELRRLVAERSRRVKSAARAVDPAGDVEMEDAAALSDPADGEYVDETEPQTATTPRTTSAPTWDAQVPPLQDPALYDWTQSSPIPALGALIARREDIFTKQRTFNQPELQRKSEELIATKLATYARSGSYSGFGYKIGAYCSFCRTVDIPSWPASPPVFALFAHQVSYYATSSRAVLVAAFNMVHKVCRDLWDPLPVFKQLLGWPGAQAAVIEWKKQAPTTPAADGPAPRPQGAAWVEGEGDKDSSAQSTTSKKKKKNKKQKSTNVPQHLCRGLPGVGATFPSTQAAHKEIVAAIVPVYGVGVDASHPSTIRCSRHGAGCPMRINLGLGGGRWRVLESSNFIHNHERDPKIVKDPTWRPYIRNSTAREAVEERDKAINDYTDANPKKRDDNPGPDPPAPKRQARGPPAASLPERLAFLPQPPRPTPTIITAPALPDAGVAATSNPTSPSVEPAVPPPPPPPASTTASPAPSAPVRRSGVTPSFQLVAPDPAAFVVDLTAFLSALDPSLAPRARPLHSAGISTLRDLRAFVQFEPASRMALYEDLHSSGGPDAALLDVELVERFEEALVAAQASGWR